MQDKPSAIEELRRYTLAMGAAAVHRLEVLNEIWGPGTRAMAIEAGLGPGMQVADIGCGAGTVTRMFAELVGPTGRVVAVDQSAAQLEQARRRNAAFQQVEYLEADATATGLADASLDFVFCRLLLIHLPQPLSGLAEMRRVLRPGGCLYVEDIDIASGYSWPPSAIDRFGELYAKLLAARGLDYRIGRHLHQLVLDAGFENLNVRLNQPAYMQGHERRALEWSLEESGPGLEQAGLCTPAELAEILEQMRAAAADPNLLVVEPCMTLVTARRPAAR